jgi:hypothetical protein
MQVTAIAEDMLGLDDSAQLACATIGFILSSCIASILRPLVITPASSLPRVVATRRAPHEVASRIVMLLNTLTADKIRNQILYV